MGGGLPWDEDELMDVDVDRNEVNVAENEMDVHDVVQVEGWQQRSGAVPAMAGPPPLSTPFPHTTPKSA